MFNLKTIQTVSKKELKERMEELNIFQVKSPKMTAMTQKWTPGTTTGDPIIPGSLALGTTAQVHNSKGF